MKNFLCYEKCASHPTISEIIGAHYYCIIRPFTRCATTSHKNSRMQHNFKKDRYHNGSIYSIYFFIISLKLANLHIFLHLYFLQFYSIKTVKYITFSKIRDISCYDINVTCSYVTSWRWSFKISQIQIPFNFPVFTAFEREKEKRLARRLSTYKIL